MDEVEEIVPLADRELAVLRPRDSEALLDEEAFEREERMPYWAELWPSGVALARAISGRSLRGRRVLELGCGGLALPSIAAALGGARVLATDWSEEAVALAARNAERNGAALGVEVCAWERPDAVLAAAPWSLVLLADVLYERRNGPVLLDLLPRLVDERGEVWLADPGRPPTDEFLDALDGRMRRLTGPAAPAPEVTVHRFGGAPA